MPSGPYVIDAVDEFNPDDLFLEGRDQLVLAIRISAVFGQFDLALLAAVLEEANARGLSLAREQPLRDEYLLIVLEAYDD
ncbi:MAG TPA: hypothetical protein VHC41_04915 [Mycobacteriales bacterium]|nr:hypothetical protein [Mycobacteriales bacterium]